VSQQLHCLLLIGVSRGAYLNGRGLRVDVARDKQTVPRAVQNCCQELTFGMVIVQIPQPLTGTSEKVWLLCTGEKVSDRWERAKRWFQRYEQLQVATPRTMVGVALSVVGVVKWGG
jgi:hypothetical protein